jgi:uncharacterized protein with HEPN domain
MRQKAGRVPEREAARNVMHMAPQLEREWPEVWLHLKDAYDMRIILTHEYFRIDVAVVWDTVRNDLPKLKSLLDGIAVQNDGGGEL